MAKTNNRLISREKAAEMLECTPQTISNWVDKGIIKGHKVGNNLLVDKSTIIALLDTAQDVAHATEEIQRLQAATTAYRRNLEMQLQFDYKRNELGLLNNLNCEALQALLAPFSCVITEYEFDVLSELIGDNSRTGSLQRIAKKHGISPERVRQIAVKAARRIRICRSYKSVRDENRTLTKANEELKRQVAMLESDLNRLRTQHMVEKGIPTSVADIKLVDIDGITIRSLNVCKAIDVLTLGELALCSPKRLLHTRNCGYTTIRNLEKVLDNYGLKFKTE